MRWILSSVLVIQQLHALCLGIFLSPVQCRHETMPLYTKAQGIAPGLNSAINAALYFLPDPQGYAPHLLDGTRKQLVIRWRGDTAMESFDHNWDATRGDGAVDLYHGTQAELFPWPPNVDPATLNIRMGVPLWVAGKKDGSTVLIAYGLYHPLYNCAQLDYFNTETRDFIVRMNYLDPRMVLQNYMFPEDVAKKMNEQRVDLRERGASLREDRLVKSPVLVL